MNQLKKQAWILRISGLILAGTYNIRFQKVMSDIIYTSTSANLISVAKTILESLLICFLPFLILSFFLDSYSKKEVVNEKVAKRGLNTIKVIEIIMAIIILIYLSIDHGAGDYGAFILLVIPLLFILMAIMVLIFGYQSIRRK